MSRIVSLIAVFLVLGCKDHVTEFDESDDQIAVTSHGQIDSVFSLLTQISYDELPETYLNYTDPYRQFENQLKEHNYFVLKGNDILRFIVGKNRIEQFVSADGYKRELEESYGDDKKIYWLCDPKLIHWILEFQIALADAGYNSEGFYVRESHRHPKYNTLKGGASQSQHLYGKAADLVIEDIDNDGEINDLDKEIALKILEEIVGNEGGMGLYPGTMTVHIDTRGYAARWESY